MSLGYRTSFLGHHLGFLLPEGISHLLATLIGGARRVVEKKRGRSSKASGGAASVDARLAGAAPVHHSGEDTRAVPSAVRCPS